MAIEPNLERLQQAFLAADRAGDVETATMLAQSLRQAQEQRNTTHSVGGSAGTASNESKLFQLGRTMPLNAQIIGKAGNILSLGALKRNFPELYELNRGASAQLEQDRPFTSAGVTGASIILPALAIGGETVATKAVNPAMRMAKAMIQGAVPSGIQGALESDESSLGGMIKEGLKGAALGAAPVPVLGAVGAGVGAVARNVGERVGPLAVPAAQRRLAVTLERGMPEGYKGTAAQYAMEELKSLGPEGRLIDVNPETRRLADVLATVPGRARSIFEPVMRERQAGRYGRVMGAANEALERDVGEYMPTLDALIAQRKATAGPLYEQVQNLPVQVDDEMLSLLRRAGTEALGKAKRLARLAGEDQLAIGRALQEARDAVTNAAIPGKPVPFGSLDHVKQSLYDLETAYARKGEKTEAAAFGNLRRQLTAKLDAVSPKNDQGQSIYQLARQAYEGPSQLANAMELGRSAFNKANHLELKQTVNAMTDAEKEAFQVGAIQALREKAGSQSGQTSLLKQWKEENTAGPLRMIFGDKYNAFVKALDREAKLKEAEAVGQGSQTASRMYGAGDLDAQTVMDAGQLVTQGASGNIPALIGAASKAWNRVQLPERTRNELAKLLAQGGGDAQTQLQMLDVVMRRMRENAARNERLAGAVGSMGYRTQEQ